MSAFEYINQLQSLAIYKYLAIHQSCKGDVHYADTHVTAVRQGGRSYMAMKSASAVAAILDSALTKTEGGWEVEISIRA
jgi:hypothetical protein